MFHRKTQDSSICRCPARWAAKAPSSQRSWHCVRREREKLRRNNVNRGETAHGSVNIKTAHITHQSRVLAN
jgi:hypothetical protein